MNESATPGGVEIKDFPELPDPLPREGFCLRPLQAEDLEFLRTLYVTLRWRELEPLTNWTDEMKVAFLEQQHLFQHRHYTQHYEGAVFGIVEKSGLPVGRLYLHRSASELRVMDIGFLPEWRNRGLGAALLRGVLNMAESLGLKVSIHVETFNPARHLYERLGFVEVGGDEVYRRMEWNLGSGESGLMA